ncbi:hypothetical protein V1L52_07895 [Treponema sp. HNW]|uniref:hypothetical protein n=1 Tax=Treponema sp. HNW TaxID=3116654 RepID=UPI003D0F11B4
MNTIPLIFDERKIKRTVLGTSAAFGLSGDSFIGEPTEMRKNASGKATSSSSAGSPLDSFAVVLLNRGGNHYCSQSLESLAACGFKEIVVVENSGKSYGLEELSQRFPYAKFIIPLEDVNCGDMINMAIGEIVSPFALVIWDNMKIREPVVSPSLAEHIKKSAPLCTAPLLASDSLHTLPVCIKPDIKNTVFSARCTAVQFPSGCDTLKTLYPFDFIGIYNKEKFMRLGGFDYTFDIPYWQNLDFALRAWLWGERICINRFFRLSYEGEAPLEDSSADYAQLTFFLKNCAPVVRSDYAYIPLIRFFDFCRRYPGSPFRAHGLFSAARSWVRTNRFRYKTDIGRLIENWDTPLEEPL